VYLFMFYVLTQDLARLFSTWSIHPSILRARVCECFWHALTSSSSSSSSSCVHVCVLGRAKPKAAAAKGKGAAKTRAAAEVSQAASQPASQLAHQDGLT
jgi:hypothetical protein